jgi:hypothetical protein
MLLMKSEHFQAYIQERVKALARNLVFELSNQTRSAFRLDSLAVLLLLLVCRFVHLSILKLLFHDLQGFL